MFVQTCQYGEGCYLNCIQSLHKRLSMRSCNYSEVLITPWHDVIVLALHTSVGVFLKEVAFVAPSWWLLSRSCSLHQGDILEWQCDTSLRRRRSAQQGTATSMWCFPILPVLFKGGRLWFSRVSCGITPNNHPFNHGEKLYPPNSCTFKQTEKGPVLAPCLVPGCLRLQVKENLVKWFVITD